MQENQLYEYSIIRVVPRVERGEFINVGVVLFCKKTKFIKMLYSVDEAKLRALCEDVDIEQVRLNLQSFEKISAGQKDGGPIAQLDPPSRFRWLTAMRSSVIQTSRPHPGLCINPDETLSRLLREVVL